jgi:DNA-3-methyladenine glycosylase
MKLGKSFYQKDDAVLMAKIFLGKFLVTSIDGKLCAAMITETEAYAGIHDKASHAYRNKHTVRTSPMFQQGGIAYVYLIYGMYSLFNIVTAPAGIPHAILIRAVHPADGIPHMLSRRNTKKMKGLSDGPGKLSQALGIHYSDSGTDLCGDHIWIEDRGIIPEEKDILIGPRINVDYAGKDALLPYRFIYRHSL